MKAMLTAFVVAAVIAVGAYYTLNYMGFGAGEHSAGADVRLD
jgi:hypothetical protein